MRLYQISLNNLRRRKSKMAFLVISLVICITTVVALLIISLTMKDDIDKKLDTYGANIIVVPKSEELSLSYGGMAVSGASIDVRNLTKEDLEKIKTIKNYENISVVAPKLIGAAQINNTKVLIVGINVEDELWLKKWWKINGKAPEDTSQVLLGTKVANRYGKNIGDKLNLNNKEYTISGILDEMGDQEDSVVFMTLSEAQRLLNKENTISLIEISARCNTCPIEEMTRQLGEAIPNAQVSAVKQVVQSKMDTLRQFTRFGILVSGIIVLISVMIVFITMMSSVNERVREIGIFRAIGYRKKHILDIILMEALVVSLIGGALGLGLGLITAKLISNQMTDIEVPMYFNIWIIIGSLGLAVFISILASLYPALRASRQEPHEALRFI